MPTTNNWPRRQQFNWKFSCTIPISCHGCCPQYLSHSINLYVMWSVTYQTGRYVIFSQLLCNSNFRLHNIQPMFGECCYATMGHGSLLPWATQQLPQRVYSDLHHQLWRFKFKLPGTGVGCLGKGLDPTQAPGLTPASYFQVAYPKCQPLPALAGPEMPALTWNASHLPPPCSPIPARILHWPSSTISPVPVLCATHHFPSSWTMWRGWCTPMHLPIFLNSGAEVLHGTFTKGSCG